MGLLFYIPANTNTYYSLFLLGRYVTDHITCGVHKIPYFLHAATVRMMRWFCLLVVLGAGYHGLHSGHVGHTKFVPSHTIFQMLVNRPMLLIKIEEMKHKTSWESQLKPIIIFRSTTDCGLPNKSRVEQCFWFNKRKRACPERVSNPRPFRCKRNDLPLIYQDCCLENSGIEPETFRMQSGRSTN